MVEICKFTNCFNELTSALDEAGIDYSTEECLGRCDLCHSTAFVQKDDEFISDDNIDVLINKIK